MSRRTDKKRRKREDRKRRQRMQKFQRRKVPGTKPPAQTLPAQALSAQPLPSTEVLREDVEIAASYVQTLVRQTYQQTGKLLPLALALAPGPDHKPEAAQLYTFMIQAVTPAPPNLLADGVQGFQAAVGAIATVTATPAQDGDKAMMFVVAVDSRELRAWGAAIVDSVMEPFVEMPDFAARLSQVPAQGPVEG